MKIIEYLTAIANTFGATLVEFSLVAIAVIMLILLLKN